MPNWEARLHSPPPAPWHPPLHPGIALPCAWSELKMVPLHPFYNAHSVGIVGFSPIPQKATQSVCEQSCEDNPRCVAYTFRYQNMENKCWLLSQVGPGQGANGAHRTQGGFISAFCTRGGRGTCCFDGATRLLGPPPAAPSHAGIQLTP